MENKKNFKPLAQQLGIDPSTIDFRMELLKRKDSTLHEGEILFKKWLLNPDQIRLPDLSYLAKEATEGMEKNKNIEKLHRLFHDILGDALNINNKLQNFELIDKQTRKKYHLLIKEVQEGLQKIFNASQTGTYESRADIIKQKPIYYPGDGDIAHTKE